VVGGTPGGITAAVGAARRGHDVTLLERTDHIGGLPANGLGATDIETRGATGGLFETFVSRVEAHYADTYGPDSEQVAACDDGYHFEPSIAETVFEDLVASHGIDVRRARQFDPAEDAARVADGRLVEITVTNREAGAAETYAADTFVDATYEGDLAAAAGVPFEVGREGEDEHDEPLAGRVYKRWEGAVGDGSTGEADNAIQAYNYRLCLTTDPDNRLPIPKPDSYDRSEYADIVTDIEQNRHTVADSDGPEGMSWFVNMVDLPNEKVDANNQHAAFCSTDLPEENWPWPTSSWDWRERFADRLREYTLGLLWFAQNDPELPAEVREAANEWGLAADEYADNEGFPRQVYVREGRRVRGEYWFTAHDALPETDDGRPPVHPTSVTASHYAIDSHAVRKREPGRVHLDGFLQHDTEPYTVPYGVIVPQEIDGLLTPVPVSGTHIGFSTLRMEPCWMALGEAAGVAAGLSAERETTVRDLGVWRLQRALADQGAVLMYFDDVGPDHEQFPALQFFGVRGFVTDWEARLDEPVSADTAADWCREVGVEVDYTAGETTRGTLLQRLYETIDELAEPSRIAAT
jgi:hypothetical protein